MFTHNQIRTMLRLQDQINTKIDPHWMDHQHPYMRAVIVEAAEAMEHYGWKWWKNQNRDMAQVQMELVDIWHFILSEILLNTQGDIETAALLLDSDLSENQQVFTLDNCEFHLDTMDFVEKLELMIGLAVLDDFSVSLVNSLMVDCQFSWNDMFTAYVGKNVLNMFRQDHGYKDGSYIKIWHGREDNECLTDILQSVNTDADNIEEILLGKLEEVYATLQQ